MFEPITRALARFSTRHPWIAIAIVFLIASTDEGVGFHEMLVRPMWVLLDIDDARSTFVWIIQALLVAVLILSRFQLTLDRPVRRLIMWGVATQITRLSGSVRLNLAGDVARSTTAAEVER